MQHSSYRKVLLSFMAIFAAVALTACAAEEADDGTRRFGADAPGEREGAAGEGPADEGGGSPNGDGATDGSNGGTNGSAPSTKKRPPGIPDEGRYTYRVVTEGREKPGERLFDVVDGDERDAGGFRQFLTWSVDEEATRFLVAQTDEGAIVEAEQRARGPEVASMCIWKPEYLDTPRNAEAGQAWEVNSSCEADGAARKRTMTGKVVAVQQQTLDGRTFKVLVITRTISTTTKSKDIAMAENEEYTDRYAPDLGLLISREGTRTTTLQGVPRPPIKSRMELTSLKGGKVPYDE